MPGAAVIISSIQREAGVLVTVISPEAVTHE